MTNESLVKLYQNGDESALDALVSQNMGLIRRVANKYAGSSYSIEDSMQDGVFGIIEAAKRFDLSKGLKFTTFAYFHITKEIRDGRPDGNDWVTEKIRKIRNDNPLASTKELMDMCRKALPKFNDKNFIYALTHDTVPYICEANTEDGDNYFENASVEPDTSWENKVDIEKIISNTKNNLNKAILQGIKDGMNMAQLIKHLKVSRPLIYLRLKRMGIALKDLNISAHSDDETTVKLRAYNRKRYLEQKAKKLI